ncbi:tRNA (5-methylaminomethyl-2-thiouridylate)-methyltransferase [Eubacterium ruminantium]|nr:tRNA (5-methylaminomethyl-2-thiouridylate)-methyltransferase [Eubacterium ruminantium]
MSKVIVGMSGGVDSAVAAYLLKIAGYEVSGLTIRIWISSDGKDSRCCEIDDARRTAMLLDIPYYVQNSVAEFNERVTRPFVNDYICGLTPNPCIECNRYVKWGRMLETADLMHAEYVATGHYANIIHLDNGRYTVKTAIHAEKDQTYMLYRLTQEQLKRTIMPLGGLSKEEVRNIARKVGLDVADKADSQEICFVPEGKYTDYIEENAEVEVPGEGNFVDEDGKVLGKHKGIIHYTIGQRKGLGIALGRPIFVKKINASTNEVVLADETALYSTKIICRKLNFLSIEEPEIGEKVEARVKIRYHHSPQKAVVEMLGEDRAMVSFEEPVRAATPGQSAVFYDDEDCVIGGGLIVEVME